MRAVKFVAILMCLAAFSGPVFAAEQTVADKIAAVFVEHLGVAPQKVTPSARLKEDLGADDLDVVEVVMALEETFGIKIEDAEAQAARTVADFTRLVESRLKK